jgi:hypothetical protein
VPAAPQNDIAKLGAVAIRQFKGRRFGRQEPRLIGQVFYYLEDASKRGQFGGAVAVSFKLGK